MPTTKQIAANRQNAQRSTGPTNTASTRNNASKHGLSAAGVTALDSAEGFGTILSDLEKETNPVGTIEEFLVESVALEIVRLRRARRLEAQHIDVSLNPRFRTTVPISSTQLDPGLPASITLQDIHPLVKLYPRYEAMSLQRFFRFVHELERLQRMRQGERLPAPAALDVSVHHDSGIEAGAIPLPQEETLVDQPETEFKRVTLVLSETEVVGDQEVKG